MRNTKERDQYVDLAMLRSFVLLMQEQQLSSAARKLGVERTSLVRRIQRLEQAMRTTLFVRTKVGVTPTATAHAVLAEINQMLMAFENAKSKAQRRGAVLSPVRIGAVETVCVHVLPPLLSQIGERFRTTPFFVSKGMSEDLALQVARGELDLAIVLRVESLASTLKVLKLWRDRYVLAVHDRHPLAQTISPVDVATLTGEQFVVSQRCRVFHHVEALFRLHHCKPRVSAYMDDYEDLLPLVAKRQGVALLPHLMREDARYQNVRMLPIRNQALARDMVLVHRGDPYLSDAACVFKELLIKYAHAHLSHPK